MSGDCLPPFRHALLIGIRDYLYPGFDLGGPKNDVLLIGTLLRDHFGFPEENLHVLLDDEATRAGILRAFDDMVDRVGAGDVVVFFYSGHGSRMANPSPPREMFESIVPHDSGRGERPNRDVVDVEINRWVRRLNEKTTYVTLILDCCHAGSVTRNPFAPKARWIEADRRRPEEMFEGGRLPAFLEAPTTRSPGATRDQKDVLSRQRDDVDETRRAVVIAACRAEEEAQETMHRDGGRNHVYGAMSHFLGRTLATVAAGATWRDVFETAAPAVTARFPRQHPQVEGNWDQVLFGTHEVRVAPYLKVTGVEGAGGVSLGIELGGGVAHAVSRGSVWSLHPPGTRHAEATEELARVRVESVGVASCQARLEAAAAGHPSIGELAVGQRAFLRAEHLPEPGLRIALEAPADRAGELRRRIGESTLVDEADPAGVLVRCLAPRAVVAAGAPCPDLGPLREWTWAAVGEDGRLSVRTRGLDDVALLVADLESRARYDRLLEIHNPDPASHLSGRVRLVVTRRTGEGRFVVAEPHRGDGLLAFEEGEVVDFEVHNDHHQPVWITLLQFGCDGTIARLVPLRGHPAFRPGGHRLAPGEVLKLGEYYRQDARFYHWDGVHVELPGEPGDDPDTGLVHLKLMVTLEPADFELVEQNPLLGPSETRDVSPRSHPLLQVVRLYACGLGKRSLPPCSTEASASLDWTTVTRPVVLRRREQQTSGSHPDGSTTVDQNGSTTVDRRRVNETTASRQEKRDPPRR